MEDLPQKSTRRFSKRMLLINGALAWIAVYFAIWQGQAESVAAAGLGLVGVLYGAYTGIGHLDLRSAVKLASESLKGAEGDSNDA